MTRIVWWLGDAYVRFERHGAIAVLTCFAFLSVVWVLGLHMVDKNGDGTLPWQSAIPVGLLVGFIGTGCAVFLARRRH